jgi:hypothetical protein
LPFGKKAARKLQVLFGLSVENIPESAMLPAILTVCAYLSLAFVACSLQSLRRDRTKEQKQLL